MNEPQPRFEPVPPAPRAAVGALVTPLFGYGTFRDPVWRAEILGTRYDAVPAVLAGWERIALESGYLSLRRAPLGVVSGVLVALDEVGWRVADAWEDVPSYRRVPVTVRTIDGEADALAYVSRNGRRAVSFGDDARLAAISDREVLEAIAAFVPRMREIRTMSP